MSNLRKTVLFLFGVVLGIFLLQILLGDKLKRFRYWFPEGRVLTELSKKKLVIDAVAKCQFACYGISDEKRQSFMNELFEEGNVIFDASEPRKKPFPIYRVEYPEKDIKVQLQLGADETEVLEVSGLNSEKNCHCN